MFELAEQFLIQEIELLPVIIPIYIALDFLG